MPKETVRSSTEGTSPAESKQEFVDALKSFAERIEKSQKKVTFARFELVDGMTRWKVIEEE